MLVWFRYVGNKTWEHWLERNWRASFDSLDPFLFAWSTPGGGRCSPRRAEGGSFVRWSSRCRREGREEREIESWHFGGFLFYFYFSKKIESKRYHFDCYISIFPYQIFFIWWKFYLMRNSREIGSSCSYMLIFRFICNVLSARTNK